MAKNKVGELVLKAKGERSYREYQKDSGVDAAVISKIVNGTYIPKNPEVYRKLTSCESNGVSFEELIEAADYTKEYKNGMIAGVAATQAALTTLGAASMAMVPGIGVLLAGLAGATGALGASVVKANLGKAQNVDKVEEYLNDIQRFSAISNGIIFSKLAQSGILFQQETTKEIRLFENEIDTYLAITNRDYSEYIIRYLFFNNVGESNDWLIENTTRKLVEELVFIEASKSRKISIVTDSMNAFKFLKKNANKLSYRGNLTAILLDTQTVSLLDEIVISLYDETINKDDLKIM